MRFLERLSLWHRAFRYALRTEKHEIALVRALVKRGECVVDIGAHRAAFAWWMARCVGPEGLVLAFEPIPELAEYLRRVAGCFPQGQLRVIESALSNKAGRTLLHFAGDHLGAASIEIHEDRLKPPVEVATETLDEHLAAHYPDRCVTLIKCDVEHHEWAVFQGARRTLATAKPILLFESANLADGQECYEPVFQFLQSLGYVGYFFNDGALVSLAEYEPGKHRVGDLNQNFVFTHPARVGWHRFSPPYAARAVA